MSVSGFVHGDKEKGDDRVDTTYSAPEYVIPSRFGVFGPVIAKMFASGVEARGVERVPEKERETKNIWNK
jgi:hypothetical protein